MADKNWPSWRYGPSGEAQIFAREADVPKGWVDSPSKLPPAPEKLGGDAGEMEVLRACEETNESLRAEKERLQAELNGLREELALVGFPRGKQARTAASSSQPEEQDEARTARRPRKLSTKLEAPGTPFTPADETVTLDEGRAERLKVLREAHIEIADDATDGDIEEALDWLEKQG